MARSTDWTIYTLNSDGVTWALETSFPRPNQDLETQKVSTMQTVKLANGDEAFVTPEVRRTKEAFSMMWFDTTATFRNQIDEYINFGESIKMITHTNEVFIGRLLDYKRVWLTGCSPDQYDIAVTFKPTD
jgi:hypothetical protein